MNTITTTDIYIKLLEGTEAWVPVQAISYGNDIFEIRENQYLDLEEDVTSIWEFFPGDIVKCKKQDNHLVAYELVDSKFANRKIHQLIFLIVKSLGKVEQYQLHKFEDEIKQLCLNKEIIQRQHPIVKEWLYKNCKW
jgi:hypothetical protein